MAKRIPVEERRLTIGHAELDSPVVQIFETAEDEVTRGKVRVDCLMGIGNRKNQLPIDITELAVEIKVTHAVDEQKKAELRELGLSTIEINLSELVQIDSTLSLRDIRKAICDTPSNITWIDLETPESTQLELVLDQESESPTAERPCPDCGAELSEEASVCTSCGTVEDETDIQLSKNRPEPSPEGIGPEIRQNTGARERGKRIFRMAIEQYNRTGILAAPGTITSKPYRKTTKPKRAGKRTNRKKHKR